MTAASVHAGDPAIRRAVRWLSDALGAGRGDDVSARARALGALARSGGATIDVLAPAAKALGATLGEDTDWRVAREIVEALAAYEAKRLSRPRREPQRAPAPAPKAAR